MLPQHDVVEVPRRHDGDDQDQVPPPHPEDHQGLPGRAPGEGEKAGGDRRASPQPEPPLEHAEPGLEEGGQTHRPRGQLLGLQLDQRHEAGEFQVRISRCRSIFRYSVNIFIGI